MLAVIVIVSIFAFYVISNRSHHTPVKLTNNPQLKPGDLVFLNGKGLSDWMMRWVLQFQVTHAMIAIGDGTNNVIECGSEGVRIRSVENIPIVTRRVKKELLPEDILREYQKYRLVKFTDDLITEWMFGYKLNSHMHCSEFVGNVLVDLGLMDATTTTHLLSPQDLLVNKSVLYE